MLETVTIMRETIYMNADTGECFETHAAAMEEYRSGERIQVLYRYKSEENDWSKWNYGPIWEH